MRGGGGVSERERESGREGGREGGKGREGDGENRRQKEKPHGMCT